MAKKIHITERQLDILNPIISHENVFALFETLEGERKELYEGLIRSYSPHDTAKYLERYFKDGMVSARVPYDSQNPYDIIIARLPNDERYIEAAKKFMDYPCGYTAAMVEIERGGNEVQITFEPKFKDSIDAEILKKQYLIHVSPWYNRDKILKQGFCPKFKNRIFNYNDRIYFFSTESQPQSILNLSVNVAFSKDERYTDNLFDFYYVDPNKIDLGGKVSFHRDSMVRDSVAYWTYDNIPPSCIIDIKRFKCNKRTYRWELVENKNIR